MAFLLWLQETRLAIYVQEDPWGYPIVLSCHAVGMALLAGIVLMINFRLLGFARAVPLYYLRKLLNIAWAGLILNLISGLMLFVADAVSHFENIAFRVKILLLITGAMLLVLQSRSVFAQLATDHGTVESASTRIIAGISVLVWTGVIVAGRLIAYAAE
jgi:hypothetical protein